METEIQLVPCAAVCPGCGGSMTQLAMTQGVAAGCRACGGIWIDHIVSRAVTTATLSEPVKAFIRHIAEGVTGPAPATYRTAARRDERVCPVCQKNLVATVFGERELTIDLCGVHGTYFDLRELDAVIFDVEMKAAIQEGEADAFAAAERQRRYEAIFGTLGAILSTAGQRQRSRWPYGW